MTSAAGCAARDLTGAIFGLSIEVMMQKQLEAIGQLTAGVGQLAGAVEQLVDLTKALHRERAVQLRQEYEEAKGDDDPKRVNFSMWFLHERLRALEISTGGEVATLDESQMPTLAEPNGVGKGY